MPTARTIIRSSILILFVFLHSNYFSFSQTSSYPIKEWVKKLGDTRGSASSGVNEVLAAVKNKDSVEAFGIFNELEKRGNVRNNYFKARFDAAKMMWMRTWQRQHQHEEEVSVLARQALNAAYETNNDSLISEMAWIYGIACYQDERTEPAAMYLLFAAELDEKIGRIPDADKCLWLGATLYKTRDYRKAMYYSLASIQREADTSTHGKRLVLSRYNTVGVCYQRMGNYDSAFYYYNIATKMANELNDTLWKAIISGNKGQIFYLQKNYALAKSLLIFDYSISKDRDEQISAANSLQWVARIDLAEGKKDSALIRIKEALRLMQKKTDQSWAYYWQNVYYAAADVYRAFGNNDSVYKYSELYNNVHDSLERAVADSRLEISRIKLDNLQNELAIKNLQKDKEAIELKRNFILLSIVLIALSALFILNRQRQKLAHKQQMAQAEVAAAREQMLLFKQNVIEKTNLIEKLQDQVKDKETTAEQLQILDELTQHTILTEDDWDKIKKLFEKIYPGFFKKLREKTNDITIAEQRMAALTKMNLTTRQTATMLGISVDSVHKARQRLRQRLNFPTEARLEEFIGNF
jgi:DNA-binding CsgD family transcriptional regulator